jgi:outer membrane protease
MRRIELRRWLKKQTQQTLAYQTGFTQSAISFMARSKRRIYVVTEPDGDVYLEEIKRLTP